MTVQLISFTPDLRDLKIELYEVWIAALVAAKRIPEGRLVYIAVDDVNAPNGVRIELVPRSDNAHDTTESTDLQVTALQNALVDKPVAQLVTRGVYSIASAEVISQMGNQPEQAEPMTKALKAGNLATTATKNKRAGRKALYSDDMIVRLKVRGNPKRTNSAAYGRFAAMMRVVAEGKGTVAQVLAAGVLRTDLTYDVDHNYIEVVEVPPE